MRVAIITSAIQGLMVLTALLTNGAALVAGTLYLL